MCVGVSGFMQHGVINYDTDERCDPEQKAECVEQVDKPCKAMRLLLVAQRQNRSVRVWLQLVMDAGFTGFKRAGLFLTMS